MPSKRRSFLAEVGSVALISVAGCAANAPENAETNEDCPTFDDEKSVCTDALSEPVFVLADHTEVTPDDQIVTFRLYNRSDQMFQETAFREIRKKVGPNQWKRVGQDERSGNPAFVPAGNSIGWKVTFSQDPPNEAAIDVDSGEKIRYAFVVRGQLKNGEEQNYVATVTVDF